MRTRPTSRPPHGRTVALAAGLDALAVVVFVAVGRRSHDEANAVVDVLETALPFLIGLALGWAAVRAWRRPVALTTALVVWPVTVLAGMLVRRWAFDDGTAASFVVVATLFLGGCFVGWRAAYRSRRLRVARRGATTTWDGVRSVTGR